MKKKRRSAYALPMVLVVVVVLSILFVALATMMQTNTKQVAQQEDNLRAYYLARSGIDISYAALMSEESGTAKIHAFIADGTTVLTDTLTLTEDGQTLGTVAVTVSVVGDDVRFKAEATANGGGSSTLNLYVEKDDFSKTRWER